MAVFSAPPLRFPIGQFEVDGQRDPVYVYPDQAFWDYITNVFERIGGAAGLSTDEVVALIEATQAGEQVIQPAKFEAAQPDIVQPATFEAQFPDVMQPGGGDQMTEVTFQ